MVRALACPPGLSGAGRGLARRLGGHGGDLRSGLMAIEYDARVRRRYANHVPPYGAGLRAVDCRLRGYGAAGSASAWHAEGQGFESP